jgi:FkbM family methyltransferase
MNNIPIGQFEFSFLGIEPGPCQRWAKKCYSKEWEPPIIDILSNELIEGDVFFDIGAFLGPYSLLGSKLVGHSGRVIAFEPDPEIYKTLLKNLKLNCAENIIVEKIAIGSYSGEQQFHSTCDSMSHLNPNGGEIVSVVSLDEYCKTRRIWPDVIKIDIEGGERCFYEHQPEAFSRAKLVLLEVHPLSLETNGVKLGDFLRNLAPYKEIWRKSKDNFHIILRR